ncbi:MULTISPECIES: hypothetical protein [Geobacillus]|uniref:Uncharacterized protein n=1 Tax=Geobacillus zalihae TaxID=213419 RepID=A0A7H1RVE5_9BACL|nr:MULTISPECIES: hypothetical protein [Geobacillus]QNU18234.1 hypothetical protein IC807_00590 [Geobacillus zalihae]
MAGRIRPWPTLAKREKGSVGGRIGKSIGKQLLSHPCKLGHYFRILFQIISDGFRNNVQNVCGLFQILHILSERLHALSDKDFQRA